MTTKLPRHGYVINADNSSGTPVDLSSSCGDCSIDPTKNMGTVFTADTRYRQNVEGGGLFVQVNVQVIRTTGLTEAYANFRSWLLDANPAARTLTIDWPNSSSGSERLTGEFSLQSFQAARRSPGSGEAEILEAVLVSDGAFTLGAI